MKPRSIIIITFAIEHRPDAGSACPMFDLTEPIRSAEFLKKDAFKVKIIKLFEK